MGLGGPARGIFHPRWSARHRRSVETALTSSCVITRRGEGDGVSGPDGSWTPPARAPIYRGVCRIAAKGTVAGSAENRVVFGERQITERDYLVQVPDDAPEIEIGDLVEITENDADPTMTGTQLRVTDIQLGSQSWLRDLVTNEVLKGE